MSSLDNSTEDGIPLDEEHGYLQFDIKKNALDYLERAAKFVEEMEEDARASKWVAIALHGALYSFAACKAASIHTNIKVQKFDKRTGTYRLKGIWQLLRMCDSKDLLKKRKTDIELVVTSMRNYLQHTIPSSTMVMNYTALVIASVGVLDVIEELLESCFWFKAPADEEYKPRALKLIEKTVERLVRIQTAE